jgi:uncharacterized protein YndB with AHSA1/START domain
MKPVVHGNFSIERVYRAPVDKVYAAWAQPEVKARWFMGPPASWKLLEFGLDLRVGGREVLRGTFSPEQPAGECAGPGVETRYEARFHEIVPGARLVYVYDMFHGERQLSVSLSTVSFVAEGKGTRLTYTEQAAFVDGEDGTESRKHGNATHLENIARTFDW